MGGTRADDRTLTGQDLTTENVGGAAVAAVAQDGERVVLALPATVPSQDPMSGVTTTGGRVPGTVRACLAHALRRHVVIALARPPAAPLPGVPWASPYVVPSRRGSIASWSRDHAWSPLQEVSLGRAEMGYAVA